MKIYKFILVLVALVVIATNSSAEGICSNANKEEPQLFINIYKASLQLSEHLCGMEKLDGATLSNDAYIDEWGEVVIKETLKLKEAGIFFSDHVSLLKQAIKRGELPKLATAKTGSSPGDRGYLFFISNDDNSYSNFDRETNKRCKELQYKLECIKVLDQLSIAINVYQVDIVKNQYDKTYAILKEYDQSWTDYFNKARSQMLWEHMINSGLYRSEVTQNKFVKPPNYQVTFAHPSIALEYAEDAIDGEQYKNALALEWIGINYWNKDNFLGYPFGVSYTHIYSDRQGVNDNRSGWLLHLNNRYSIGYSDDGNLRSIFVSLDLFKLFEDKNQKLDRFKDYYRDYLK